MNCERFERELALLPIVSAIDDLATEPMTHALACSRCESALRERIALDRLLGAELDVAPPEGLAATVARKLGPPVARPNQATTGARRWLPIAIAAAALFSVVWALHRQPPDRGASEPVKPDAELLAQIDLLLDWELLADHGADLDLISADDLLSAVESGEEG